MSDLKPPNQLPSHHDSVRSRLAREPFRFEFFQAVRLLRWIARTDPTQDSPEHLGAGPAHDFVRFRSLPSLSFPSSPVARLDGLTPVSAAPNEERHQPCLTVTFLGLFGSSGVLPRHYTQLIIDRIRQKDESLRSFLDLFNHRIISLYWRAWAKYRLPVAFEEHYLDGQQAERDPFTRVLSSVVGMESGGLRGRLEFDDFAFLYYAGHFSHFPRNGVSLELSLADYFRVPTTVQQLHGQWLYLDSSEQSRLSTVTRQPANNRLGENVVVGQRVWGVENSFRIRLGPLTYEQFEQFMPAGPALRRLGQFVASYVGASYDFDVQLVLRSDDVPACQLVDRSHLRPPRLGWNTWLYSTPAPRHRDEAVFVPSDRCPLS